MVAEQQFHGAAIALPLIRLIRKLAAGILLQRARQDSVVARGPLEPAVRRQREHLVRDRAFGRPQPNWVHAKRAPNIRTGPLQLYTRVPWIAESLRQRHTGAGYRAHIGIAKQ